MRKPILFIIALLISICSLRAQDITIQSEFEKQEGLLLKWNYTPSVDSTVTVIASIVSSDYKVWIIADPGNPVTTEEIKAELSSRGANLANISFLDGSAENPWLRDYGPVAGYYSEENGNTRHFTDAQYDAVQFPQADFLPLQLASDFGFNYEAMPLNFEGGNLLLDGIGRGFIGDRILSQNPGMNTDLIIQTLYTKLGLNEIIILPSVPECGGGEWSELSRLVKFIDSETVLVSRFPQNTAYFQQVEAIADTLAGMYNDVGKQFQVIRLDVSPDENGEVALSNSGTIRSYTSSIIINRKVLIPSYGQPTDQTALEAYKQALPGYQIYQVPSNSLSVIHGSLYRLAVNIPQPDFFRIRHSKITGMQIFESEKWVNAFVESWQAVDSVMLFYRIHPSTEYIMENTYGCCGGSSGFLGDYTINDTISYYVQAYSGNHIQSLPVAAPETVYTFWFDLYTGLKHGNEAKSIVLFPNPASDIVFIKGLNQSEKNNYQILNLAGVLVAEGEVPLGNSIELPDYMVNGIYMIKIISSGKTHICKLYLQR